MCVAGVPEWIKVGLSDTQLLYFYDICAKIKWTVVLLFMKINRIAGLLSMNKSSLLSD